ncbi:hypothetical protein VPH35_020914 [Triticum aestivum]
MPCGLLSFFLHLVRSGGRRRQGRRRRHGVGGLRRHNRHARDLRRFRGHRNGFRRRGPRLGHGARGRDGAGPSKAPPEPAMRAAAPLPAWILAGLAAPNLYADEVLEPADDAVDVDVEPELAAPPPPRPCLVHGWGPWMVLQPPPPQDYEVQEEAEPASPVPPAEPAQPNSPRLPSPTPAHEAAGAGASSSSASLGLRLPARAATLGDVFDNWASSSTGPSAPRRWHIVPRAELQRSRAVVLGLANGHSNGVAPGTQLPGGSSSEEEDAAPGPSTSRR